MLRRFRCNYRGCLIVFNVLKAAWLRHFPCCAYIDGAAGAVVTKGTKVPPFSLVAGIPAKVIKTLDESNLDNIHAQAVKYKDLWSKRHNIMPDIDGETYHGEKIV